MHLGSRAEGAGSEASFSACCGFPVQGRHTSGAGAPLRAATIATLDLVEEETEAEWEPAAISREPLAPYFRQSREVSIL